MSDYTAFHEQMPFPKRQMPLVGVIWTKEGIWANRKYLFFRNNGKRDTQVIDTCVKLLISHMNSWS